MGISLVVIFFFCYITFISVCVCMYTYIYIFFPELLKVKINYSRAKTFVLTLMECRCIHGNAGGFY